jgi:hypothetical protein
LWWWWSLQQLKGRQSGGAATVRSMQVTLELTRRQLNYRLDVCQTTNGVHEIYKQNKKEAYDVIFMQQFVFFFCLIAVTVHMKYRHTSMVSLYII